MRGVVNTPRRKPPEPFLKWAGGKTQLLPLLSAYFPKVFNRYFEPNVGSAAVFFYLRRERGAFPATLSDLNEELINCLTVVRDEPHSLIPLLEGLRAHHDADQYYRVRKMDLGRMGRVERAARFIYLNKTCYNGLYRVNSKGHFNVPVGSYKSPNVFDESNLVATSRALRGTEIFCGDFSGVLDTAKPGDFFYFDPPYYTETAGFTSYAVSSSGRAHFGAEEHMRLSEVARRLVALGCHVVVSNSDTDLVRFLYGSSEFRINVVQARRYINCNGSGRGKVNELVIQSR